MKKNIALATLLVLGTSAVASASPYRFSARAQVRVGFDERDNRDYRDYRDYRDSRSTTLLPPRQASRVVVVRDHRDNRSWHVTPCMDAAFNVSGHYDGEAGAVTLTQRGNRIYGTFANGGVMEGHISNGKITYTWTGGEYSGRGFWYVDGHGGLIGTWGANNSDSSGGNWNLRLVSNNRLY